MRGVLVCSILAMSLVACDTISLERISRSNAVRTTSSSTVTEIYQTRLEFRQQCPVTGLGSSVELESSRSIGLGAALISSLAPKLLSSGINFISRRANQKTVPQSANYWSRTQTEMYGRERTRGTSVTGGQGKLTLRNNCAVFVRGRFTNAPDISNFEIPDAKEDVHLADWGVLASDLMLAAEPDFYVEFLIDYKSVPGAFQLAPVYLEYNRAAIKGSSRSLKKPFHLCFHLRRL